MAQTLLPQRRKQDQRRQNRGKREGRTAERSFRAKFQNSGAAEASGEKGMMSFKDILKSDVHEVFMNTDEFSDLHMVNGVEMAVQLDTNEQIEREKRMAQNVDGIYVNQKLIYVAASDFGAMPKQGSTLNLDGKIYRVADAVDEGGIYSITIEANKAR